ncbi:hypothetical protein BDN72DRAFT_957087 [Pluteus cervinus]|uniref:Uncharacterized protein n=1 Tax=Pluteus cervinus TaxID=181527 RepID=A0ACD3B4J3_9AGAR|nr:hypothetical protein BDN72DRAFT_957087 [Pluteus cervinus]
MPRAALLATLRKPTQPASSYPQQEPEEPAYSGLEYFTQLPVELLTIIAKQCHADAIRKIEYPVPTDTEPSYVKPILALAGVSQRLRSIILRESSFWSYIRIDARRTKEDVVMACLERSKSHPLTILWIGENDTNGPESPLLKTIVKRSHRWISFYILAPNATYLRLMFMEGPFCDVKAPILRKLYVACVGGDDEYFGEDTFRNFPSIQHLQMFQYPFWAIGKRMESLTRLEVDVPYGGQFSFEQLASIAEILVHLEHLSLSEAIAFERQGEFLWDEEERGRWITWPSLLVLVLRSGDPDCYGYIWQYLKIFRAPRLQKFIAIGPNWQNFVTSDADASRISLNMPLVKEVSLVEPDIDIDGDSARRLSTFFPGLAHLSLCCDTDPWSRPINGSFFDLNGLSDTKICPNLEYITLGAIQDEIVLHTIARCLQNRKAGGRGVRKVFIPRDQPRMAEILERAKVDLGVADLLEMSDYSLDPDRHVYYLLDHPPGQPGDDFASPITQEMQQTTLEVREGR